MAFISTISISCKTKEHIGKGTNIKSHAYVFNAITMELREAFPAQNKLGCRS